MTRVAAALAGVLHFAWRSPKEGVAVEEKEVTVEKRTTVRREDPADKTTNVNIGPDGTTNVQESGDDGVVEEEHIVEEHRQP